MYPSTSNVKYNDVKFFLWLIPVINIINYYLTYEHFGPLWRVATTFAIDTAQGYIAWLIVRSIILWLDKNISYAVNPLKRIVIQLTVTLLAGSLSIIVLTEFVNWLATSGPVPASFYTQDIFIISIWFFVVNGIYTGLYYHRQWYESEQKRKIESQIKIGGFKVSTPKKDLLFPFEEINGFYIDGDYCVVVTVERKKYFDDASLDKVERILPAAFFFRLNRQYIIHRQLVIGYEKSENGKINVLLKGTDYLPEIIPVSRTKAPGFKWWFVPG